MSKYALVAIGYNNANSILRLLNSLNGAEYGDDSVPLIISIDKSNNNNVEKIAREFDWKYGEKIIRSFNERQGLRKHIISCGEYLQQYEAIFVFEDDVLVSPFFYEYGKKCLNFYGSNDEVEGIALYSHKWNQNANYPFEPIKREYDTYFMRYAPSWGQIWIRERWCEFIKWYSDNSNIFEEEYNPYIPRNLYTWGRNSWLKYHIAYCELKKRYFVYPYYSYSTSFVEKSTHYKIPITRFQVELAMGNPGNLQLAPLNNNSVRYNSFFENEDMGTRLEISNLMVDLYGVREPIAGAEYILSTNALPYIVEREYALQIRPIDMNICMSVQGEGIYLYNTAQKRKVSSKEKRMQIVRKWNYFMRDRFIMFNELIPVCGQKLGNLFQYIFK